MASPPPGPPPPPGSDKEAERPGKILTSLNHTSTRKKKHSKKHSSKSASSKGY